jgi:hypothetical protein
MRIFKAPLHQQPVRDTLRYFLVLGDVPPDRQVGYVAIGAANGRPPEIGHYCVLAGTYGAQAFAAALKAAGQPSAPTAAGPIGMWPDPDGIELQLFQPPAGLVTAAVPSTLETQKDGFVVPRGVDHVLLQVSSLEKSLPYYRALYGTAAGGRRTRTGASGSNFQRIRASPSSRRPARRRSRTTRSRSRRSIAARSRSALPKSARPSCRRPTNRTSCVSRTTTGLRSN